MRTEPVRLFVRASLLIAVLLVLSSCGTPPPAKAEHDPAPIKKDQTADRGKGEKPDLQKKEEGKIVGPMTEPPWDQNDKSSIKGGGDAQDNKDDKGSRNEKVSFQKDPLLDLAKRLAAENPTDDKAKLRLAFLYAMADDYPRSEGTVTGIRDANHPFIPFFKAYLFRRLGMHKASNDQIDKIRDEAAHIQGFKIERYALCSRISGYRRYERSKSNEVKPGGVALLYVEPMNYDMTREKNGHRLHLKYSWHLYNDRMEEISVPKWKHASKGDREDKLLFQGPVREFYQSFRLPLPINLAAGDYRIKVTIEDDNQGREDSVYIPFHVPAVHK